MAIGEDGLGRLARDQLEMARSDPRLGRGRKALVADFWDSVEETERVRMLGIWGIDELRGSLEREEQRVGHGRDEPDLPTDVERSLQAAWERAAMAEAEHANSHPHLNAQALVSMTSALDALVQDFVSSNHQFLTKLLVDKLAAAAAGAQRDREAAAAGAASRKEIASFVARRFPRPPRLSGKGAGRYEDHLALIGYSAPEDRPLPDDLGEALAEVSAVRNVLVHRAGRIDGRALSHAPSLAARYQDAQLVRISRDDYRTYSAAICCYAAEIWFRGIRHWPEVSDADGPDLSGWRDHYRIGA